MPVDSDHAAPTAELEAELAKLTDELESECAQLEANEDRPIASALPAADGVTESAEPEPVLDEPISEAPDPDPEGSIDAIAQALVDLTGDEDATESDAEPAEAPTPDTQVTGLDEALGALMNADGGANEPTDGWKDSAPSDAPPIDLGAAREPNAPDQPSAAPEEEQSDDARAWEPPDPVEQVEAIDRSLADLTAELMGDEGASDGARASADAQPNESAEAAETSAPSTWAGRAKGMGAEAAKRAAPVAKTAAGYAAFATRHAVRIGGPPAKAAGLHAARAAAPLGAHALLIISKPIASRPESVRSAIGWLAMGTMFVAVITWFFVLVRTPAAPAPSEAPAAIRADDGALPAMNDEAQASASDSSDSGT